MLEKVLCMVLVRAARQRTLQTEKFRREVQKARVHPESSLLAGTPT